MRETVREFRGAAACVLVLWLISPPAAVLVGVMALIAAVDYYFDTAERDRDGRGS